MRDLSIIIVTYNSEKDISNTINSVIEKTKNIDYEIVIIDNSSSDNTVKIVKKYLEKYKNIKLYLSENRGFNYANNIGINHTKSKYIALLNPDTILVNDVFSILLDKLEDNSSLGIVGPNVLDSNLDPNITHLFFPSIQDHLYRLFGIRRQKDACIYNKNIIEKEVDSPTGACFVFRRTIINEVGLFDENYFLYFDEVDFAYRVKQKKYKNYIFTEANLIHLQGQSTNHIKENIIKYNIESYIRFVDKYYSKNKQKLIFTIFKVENSLKTLYFKIKNDKRNLQYRNNIICLKNIQKEKL